MGAVPFPVPDGDGVTSGSSAQKSLWDLNGLDTSNPIVVDYGKHASKQMEGPDAQQYNDLHPAVPGKVGDLVQYMIQLYASDPKAYLQKQQELFAGGFYGSTPASAIPWGSDPQGSTYDAWKKVLIAAQQAQAGGFNVTPDQILQQGIQQHTAAVAGQAKQPKNPLAIQLTDPAQIAASAQTAAQAVLGHNLSDGEIKHFTSEFHAAQASYSRQVYATNNDQAGGTHVLDQPDLTGRLDTFIRQGHGTEIAGNSMADYARALEAMIGQAN